MTRHPATYIISYTPPGGQYPATVLKPTLETAQKLLAELAQRPDVRWLRLTERLRGATTVLFERGEPPK